MGKNLKSPEEKGSAKHVKTGGAHARREGGFSEGEMGRGPTPYSKSHSRAPASLSSHSATAGRGGGGIAGKGDMHKDHSADVAHPSSHSEFEGLGADGE